MIRTLLLSASRALAATLALALAACAHAPPPAITSPLQGSPSEPVTSTYSEALTCIAAYAAAQSYPAPRVAIGHISDMTGAQDSFLGRRFTQGATLMAMTAASRAGFRLVERFDMGVVQVDLDYARRGMVQDAPSVVRAPVAGQIQGADLYIVGGITEFNPNIRSSGGSAFVGPKLAGDLAMSVRRNSAVFDLALDLRLVDARSTDVLAVRSLRKQVRAVELEGGLLGLSSPVSDVTAGSRALEPAQTAIREMVDRAVYEFATTLYALDPRSCLETGTARPLDGATTPGPAPLQPRPVIPAPPSPSSSSIGSNAGAALETPAPPSLPIVPQSSASDRGAAANSNRRESRPARAAKRHAHVTPQRIPGEHRSAVTTEDVRCPPTLPPKLRGRTA